MKNLKDKLIEEIEALPNDKVDELYDLVHHFRLGLQFGEKEKKSTSKNVLEFFGIWKNMSFEEQTVLENIESRRAQTLRKRSL